MNRELAAGAQRSGLPQVSTGEGDDESLTAQIIVMDERDLDDDIPGIQNLWVQGLGCGTAIVNFNQGAASQRTRRSPRAGS